MYSHYLCLAMCICEHVSRKKTAAIIFTYKMGSLLHDGDVKDAMKHSLQKKQAINKQNVFSANLAKY